ncbi:MFS transporter [Nocardia seriolae]|uniref:MFS transporter n=1 Tax=Nocardia seriolae TaxID=37332 RepID=A0ABC9YYP3_9NOCA|nr:MFS transporter [Nocardia seriolae]APA99861.1 putative MFS-type transporter [Nocardia seriolae]OJF79708.1 MFS transporter [Nocardia seriolae]PSK28999.1 MFS transporter [Nocardia seriolae]QOW36358.1 MFS transporter [Nocardia seriolae]QUN16127.1 MFS transporter [Nocardia seriolae]
MLSPQYPPPSSSSLAPGLRSARAANSVAFALQGFFLAVILTELPQVKERFSLTDGLIVAIVALISLLAGAGSVTAERLALRWSSRTALRIGLLLIAIAGVGIAFAPNRTADFVALGVYGVAVGIVDAGTNMQAVFIQHGYGRFVLVSFYAAWSAGSIAGALFVSAFEALHAPLWAAVVTAAAVVLAGGLAVGPKLLGTDAAEAGPAEHEPTSSVPVRIFLIFGVVIALAFAIDLAVGNWSALYLKDELLSSSAMAALALAAYQGASLLGRLTGDLWVRRFGPRAVVRVAAAVGAVGLVIVVAAPGPVAAILGFLIAGIGLPVIAPLCFSEAGQLTGGRDLDALIARLNLFNYAGTLVGGAVVGTIAEVANLRAGFAIPLAFAVVLIGFARVFHNRAGATARATAPAAEPA